MVTLYFLVSTCCANMIPTFNVGIFGVTVNSVTLTLLTPNMVLQSSTSDFKCYHYTSCNIYVYIYHMSLWQSLLQYMYIYSVKIMQSCNACLSINTTMSMLYHVCIHNNYIIYAYIDSSIQWPCKHASMHGYISIFT